ncbi:hypothetical protein Hanom_Chr11g00978101 [Helianthus anomalus]
MLMLSPNLVHNFSNSLHRCRDSSNRPCLRVSKPVRQLMDAIICFNFSSDLPCVKYIFFQT